MHRSPWDSPTFLHGTVGYDGQVEYGAAMNSVHGVHMGQWYRTDRWDTGWL